MWNNVLNECLKSKIFDISEVDHCLYTRKSKDSIIYILLWVDDLIIASSNDNLMNETKSLLKARFKMTDLGTPNWFLGIDFKVEKGCITMSQSAYLQMFYLDLKWQIARVSKHHVTNLLLMRRAVRFLVQNTEVL